MRLTNRARRAIAATSMAVVIGGGGIAVGAAAAAPSGPHPTSSAAPSSAARSSAARSSAARATSTPSATGTHIGAAHGAAADSYAPAVRQVLPSVVLIRTPGGLGSGVVLDDRGDIVTNAHVAGQATSFEVLRTDDPVPRPAHRVGSYPQGDLAVIRADDPAGLTPATFADSAKAQAGDVVLAVGNPLGLSASVTQGIISATGRVVSEPATDGAAATTLPGSIQTSAPINPGNSGGALVNSSGEVIGIPTLAAVSPRGGAQAQGIGFAIPANLARDVAGQLITSGHVTNSHRAALGAQVAAAVDADGQPAGAAVAAVNPGGPASRAGLQAGDVITKLGSALVPDTTALAEALAAAHPGQSVQVDFGRNTQPHTTQVTLGTLDGG
jgi:putative serine protease PepD